MTFFSFPDPDSRPGHERHPTLHPRLRSPGYLSSHRISLRSVGVCPGKCSSNPNKKSLERFTDVTCHPHVTYDGVTPSDPFGHDFRVYFAVGKFRVSPVSRLSVCVEDVKSHTPFPGNQKSYPSRKTIWRSPSRRRTVAGLSGHTRPTGPRTGGPRVAGVSGSVCHPQNVTRGPGATGATVTPIPCRGRPSGPRRLGARTSRPTRRSPSRVSTVLSCLPYFTLPKILCSKTQ